MKKVYLILPLLFGCINNISTSVSCINIIPLEEMKKDGDIQSTIKTYENTMKDFSNELNASKQIVNKYNKEFFNETDVKNLLKDLNIKSTNYGEIRNEIIKNGDRIYDIVSKLDSLNEKVCKKYFNDVDKCEYFKKNNLSHNNIYYDINAGKNYDQCAKYLDDNKKDIKDAISVFEKYLEVLKKVKPYYAEKEKEKENKILGNKKKCGDISMNIASLIVPFQNLTLDKNCIYDFQQHPFMKVFQALPDGALVTFYMPEWGDTIIKIEDDKEYVDDMRFSGENYIYTGPYRYNNVLGSMKTIHSFKKVNMEKLKLPKTYFYEGLNYVPQ